MCQPNGMSEIIKNGIVLLGNVMKEFSEFYTKMCHIQWVYTRICKNELKKKLSFTKLMGRK